MQIKRIKEFNKEDLQDLFTSVGWDSSNPEVLVKAFRNSSHVVSCFDDKKLIGIARSMDDDYWSANIDCLIVNPNYQKIGVGKRLMLELLYDLKDIKYINLCPDDKNLLSFYEKFQFKKIEGLYLQKINPVK